MIRNPSTDSEGKPELNEEEECLFSCDLCGIEFGALQGDGSLYVTTQRIIWMNRGSMDNDIICYSFSSLLVQLMVHALCKESNEPYLFLQLEHQESEIKIRHKSYDMLQEMYEALCEGQKLNPCDGDSSDGGDAFMSFGGNNDDNVDEFDDAKQRELMNEWESKLLLNSSVGGMVNNSGYLEPAADGQFDDVENIKKAEEEKDGGNDKKDEMEQVVEDKTMMMIQKEDKNDEIEVIEEMVEDTKIMIIQKKEDKGDEIEVIEEKNNEIVLQKEDEKIKKSENKENDDELDVNQIIGNINNDDTKKQKSPSFDPFHFAENIFDSQPPTPSLSEHVKGNGNDNEKNKGNPYLDPVIVKGFDQFGPQHNKTFEKKFKSYRRMEADTEHSGDTKDKENSINDQQISQQ